MERAYASVFEAARAGMTEPCGECGRPMLVGGEGVCYQCQCELHAIGVIDMDNDPWNGPVERDYAREWEADLPELPDPSYITPFPLVVRPPGVDALRAAEDETIPF